MIKISRNITNPLYIIVKSQHQLYLNEVKKYFTDYVTGFQYTPKYKSGTWDGKICLFKNNLLPYGLLPELLLYSKKCFPLFKLEIDSEVKKMFKGYDSTINYSLSNSPRDYQDDCIKTCLKYKKGIIRSCTASGKSLIIAYIIKDLREHNLVDKSLIIVPSISLCEQFKDNLIEYGFNKNSIGLVWEKEKSWKKDIVISTWQTLKDNHDKLSLYDCIMGDECHTIRATELLKIFKSCSRADWRFGFTGTLPTSRLELFNVKSFLGPLLRDYGAGELAERGFVSKCNVNIITINYNNNYKGDYNEIKDAIFNNEFRKNLISDIALNIDDNILILVSKVKKEGKILEDHFKSLKTDKEIVFLHGETDVEQREYYRKLCEQKKNLIIIATYGIFSVGINIPSLKYLMFASPVKSKIRTLQSIGRTLRIHKDKAEGAIVFDIVDDVDYLKEHGIKRERYYSMEGFNISENTINEITSGMFNFRLNLDKILSI